MRSARNWAHVLGAISSLVVSSAASANEPAKSTPSSAETEQTFRFYGQLNRAFMYWDDGRKSAVYAIDNDTSSSRLGFIGKHRLSKDLSTGYRVEIDSTVTRSADVARGEPWGDPNDEYIRLRHAYAYVENSKFGRLTFGQQSAATDDITLLNLGSQMNDAA